MHELMKFEAGFKVELTDTLKSEYWREQIGKRYAVWINQKVVFKTNDEQKAKQAVYGLTELFNKFTGEVSDLLTSRGAEKNLQIAY